MSVNGKMVSNTAKAHTLTNRDKCDRESGVKVEESDGLKY